MENKGLRDDVGWHVLNSGLNGFAGCSAAWCCSLSYMYTPVTYRQREGKSSFEAGKAEDEDTARYIHDLFTSFRLDDVWNDEHYVRLQDKGRYVNEGMHISSI